MKQRGPWVFVLVTSAIVMVTMGARQSLGLFLSPLNTHTGLGIASISFTMAIAQLVWGAVQPVFDAVADRWGLVFAIGLLGAAGAGAGSFSILIGATARRIPAERRSFAGASSTPAAAWGSSCSRR